MSRIVDRERAKQLVIFDNGTDIDFSIDENSVSFVSAEVGYINKKTNVGQELHFKGKLRAYRKEILAIHFQLSHYKKDNGDIDLFSDCYVEKIFIKERHSDIVETINMNNDKVFLDVINDYRRKYNWKKI